jgi:hypothetical protein
VAESGHARLFDQRLRGMQRERFDAHDRDDRDIDIVGTALRRALERQRRAHSLEDVARVARAGREVQRDE